MLVVSPIEHQFLEVQELQVHFEGVHWDVGIAKDLPQSDLVTDGDLEHYAGSCPQLVRTLPSADLLHAAFLLAESSNGMSDM